MTFETKYKKVYMAGPSDKKKNKKQVPQEIDQRKGARRTAVGNKGGNADKANHGREQHGSIKNSK